MFSTEKGSEQNCGSKDESIEFSNSAVIMTKEGMASDEIASAVAAVSDEIGNILNEELVEAEQIGVDLADISAELGLLAGFADGAQQADFPSLLEIALGHRGSASGSASVSSSGSTWSGAHNPRRQARTRPRRRPIHKGKEISTRRAGGVRRSVRKCDSDPSDVGDTDDSDTDQWTELDDTCTSESSSKEENASANVECNGYKTKQKPEVEMGQFLLPLLNVDEDTPSSEHFLIRHEDILQLLASAEDSVRTELTENVSKDPADRPEPDSPNSIEDETALLNYMCTAAGSLPSLSSNGPRPLDSWLLGVYHCWCEVAALIRTMLTVTVARGGSNTWDYRSQFGCHCVLCLSLAHCVTDVQRLLHSTLVTLGQDEESQLSAGALVRCLKLSGVSAPLQPHLWDLNKAKDIQYSDRAVTIIHEQLCAWGEVNGFATQLAKKICLCVPYQKPMEKQYAVERFLNILENFQTVSTTYFRIDLILPDGMKQQILDQGSTADRLDDMRIRISQDEVDAWSDYVHKCNCLHPETLNAEQRKKLMRMSIMGMMQEIDSKNIPEIEDDNPTEAKSEELPQDSVSEAKAVDSTSQEVQDDRSEYFTGDMDDESSSSLSWSSCGSGGELAQTVRSLMKNVGEIQRLMDQVMTRWPDKDRKKVDVGLSEVDRKLMAMYQRLPDVHRKQLHVYRKQKKLSTVCGRVYGSPPSPPPPGPAPHHTQHNFTEVRRKVLHMRDQQLYYHRLRIWLEDQLKHEGDKTLPDSNVTLVDDIPRRKRSDKSKPISGQKRKYRHLNPSPNTTHKILQLLKQKAPPQTMKLLTEGLDDENLDGPSVDNEGDEITPPEAFVIDKNSESDSTVIVEKDDPMKECLAKFSNFKIDVPESISPPLESTPTDNQPLPVYDNVQRMITINKFLENIIPITKTDEKSELCNVYLRYKYASFGSKIKKAMDECHTLITNYNKEKNKENEDISIDQICEVMMNLDTNSVELLEKISDGGSDDGAKLAEIVQNIPQILANVPEISNKLSEFVNASFELPEFASIMSALPELNESQLTPETLKQIRELKTNKNREAKVTKNTSKRKIVVKKQRNSDLHEYLLEKEAKYVTVARDAEVSKIASYIFDNTIKQVDSMKELREMIRLRVENWKAYIISKLKTIPCEIFDYEIAAMLEKFYNDIHELAIEDFESEQNKLIMKVEQWAHPAYLEAMKNFPQFPKIETLMIFDFYIMVYLDINTEAKSKASNITYLDVMKRCIEAPCLIRWMKDQTLMFVKTILDITGLKMDENILKNKTKTELLHESVKEMNKVFVNSLNKTNYSRDEWLITLYKLEYIEDEVKKISKNKKIEPNIREAEILAGKGLNILINSGKKSENKDDKDSNGVFLQKFKSMLKSAGHIDNEKPKETPKPLTEAAAETDASLKKILGKYANELDNAAVNVKQTLNTVGFKNLGFQSHSESDSQSEKRAEAKKCANVNKESEIKSTSTTVDSKSDTNVKIDMKNKATTAKTKVQAKQCDSAHAQHICKVGHTSSTPTPNNCGSECDQPCSCCYCTVFGHAPPVTTPVPRNFNETRERLRSILNKKKQKTNTNNVDPPQLATPPPTQPLTTPTPAARPPSELPPETDHSLHSDKATQKSAAVQTTCPQTAQLKNDMLIKVNPNTMGRTVMPMQEQPMPTECCPQQEDRSRSNGPSVPCSRESSVVSTSSGCPSFRGRDPRDLDSLLQYIEGPAPTHTRAKKRAKKERQRAKKLETRLLEEHAKLQSELKAAQALSAERSARHQAIKKKVEEARAIINSKQTQYKKGKKQKMNAAQQAKIQQVAEQLGEYTLMLNAAAKEVRESESAMTDIVTRFRRCWSELNRVRETLPHGQQKPIQQALSQPPIIHQQFSQQQQQIVEQRSREPVVNATPNMVRVVRAPGLNPGEVTLHYVNNTQPLYNKQHQEQEQQTEDNKKQTWEQALAHMNQLVQTQNKEKKKPRSEPKQAKAVQRSVTPQRSQSLTDTQTLSKKQRKLLARQQAEEEELAKKRQQEAAAKHEQRCAKETKRGVSPRREKETTKQRGKENKGDKNSQQQTKQQQQQQPNAKQQQQAQQQPTKNKKDKKKEKQQNKPQIINITPDTTLEVVRQGSCNSELDKTASCSIMEQLSCGVQVADLKLPPGITLTRVQPSEKKEPPNIKSVPIWKCSLLSSAPTPEARPQPVISADPAQRHFAHAHPEPPSSIIIPETQPIQQPGKSKKAKKKAKKAASEKPAQEAAKMVTLRNPMFHPNLPPIQINNTNPNIGVNGPNLQKKTEVRPPEPIGMPANACQATITPTSNGMFTIRNPLMSLMYQQQRQATPANNFYNYPNAYEKEPPMNLASFAQNQDEGYSLFNKSEEAQPFLSTDFYQEQKKNVSPIGTRPSERYTDNSLFTNNVVTRPEQKKENYGLYTPFGVENNDVFRHALFDKRDESVSVRDEMPYFQRLRVGTKLNQEVSVHSVSESKFFKPEPTNETFGTPWSPRYSPHYQPPVTETRDGYGPVAPPTRNTENQSMFAVNDLSNAEAMQRYEQMYMQRNKLSH